MLVHSHLIDPQKFCLHSISKVVDIKSECVSSDQIKKKLYLITNKTIVLAHFKIMEMVNVLIVKAMLCVCIAYTEEIYIYPTKQLYDINIIPTTTVHFLVS